MQGVGYRAFVLERAESLGIEGCVWNYPGGGVGVVAQADEDSLDRFARELHHGPGRVDAVQREPWNGRQFDGFRVEPTGSGPA